MRRVATRFGSIGCAAAIALACLGAVSTATAGASPQAGGGSPRMDRGVVQSVSAGALVLKVLDGSTLVARIDAKTRVFVNGRRASILDVERGFVAVVTYEPGKHGEQAKAARQVQAFGTPRSSAGASGLDSGIVQSVSATEVVLRTADRGALAVRIDRTLLAYVNGKPASILSVQPGFVAVVTVKAVPPDGNGKKGGKGKPKGKPAATEERELWAFAPQHEAGMRLELGVVPSLAPGSILLGKVGGASVAIGIDAKTRVFVNGRAGSIDDVEAGFVAVVRRVLGRPAVEVWLFGRPSP